MLTSADKVSGPRYEVPQTMMNPKLVDMVERMPAFPESTYKLMRLVSDINCQAKPLVEAIGSDPVLTINILKLVNSSYFSLSRHVASVQQALIYLGMNTIKNLAISVATMDNLPRWDLGEFTTNRFLTHSVLTGRLAQRMAKRFGYKGDSSEAFVAGLLHDFGKAVFAHAEPRKYASVLKEVAKTRGLALDVAEREAFGCDHAEAGAMLADHWQLPERLVQVIAAHHSDEIGDDPLLGYVMAANALSKCLVPGCSGNTELDMPEALCERFGMDVVALRNSFDGLNDEVEETRTLISG